MANAPCVAKLSPLIPKDALNLENWFALSEKDPITQLCFVNGLEKI